MSDIVISILHFDWILEWEIIRKSSNFMFFLEPESTTKWWISRIFRSNYPWNFVTRRIEDIRTQYKSFIKIDIPIFEKIEFTIDDFKSKNNENIFEILMKIHYV